MQSTHFTISAVHRLTGKARSTIAKHIKKGDLSFILDDDGNRVIEASEVIRVYGDHLDLDSDGNLKSKTVRSESKSPATNANSTFYEEQLERERKERERERDQLQETISHLRSDLEKSQERESRATLLLENQSNSTDRWKQQMAEIDKRIANQELETKKYRKALHEERNKTFWQRLFA